MKKEKYTRVSITIPPSLWEKFKKNCEKEHRNASSKIREFILLWEKEIENTQLKK